MSTIEERLPPRPDDHRGGMTRLGVLRDEYNATVEGRPSRFIRITDERWPGIAGNYRYFEWAARADAWALATGLPQPRERSVRPVETTTPQRMMRVSADTWVSESVR